VDSCSPAPRQRPTQLFAEAKEWHGLRRFRLRRLWRVNCEALLTAAGQNLKRLLAKQGWGRRPLPSGAAMAVMRSESAVFGLLMIVVVLESSHGTGLRATESRLSAIADER
jgi:hypothetical protein